MNRTRGYFMNGTVSIILRSTLSTLRLLMKSTQSQTIRLNRRTCSCYKNWGSYITYLDHTHASIFVFVQTFQYIISDLKLVYSDGRKKCKTPIFNLVYLFEKHLTHPSLCCDISPFVYEGSLCRRQWSFINAIICL